MRILTLSTLFPAASRPNFGIFVERQTAALAALPGFDVTVINPIGLAPWPLAQKELRALPAREMWRGLNVHRPRFTAIPRIGGRLNPAMIARAVLPLAQRLHAEKPFDLIDAEFFYPDGPAAMRIAEALGIPFTVKARGADIHHWPHAGGCGAQISEAAGKAAGLLAVSGALKADMVALGMDERKIRVHYTGLDQQRFQPRDRATAKVDLGITGPLILSIGALIPRKRQELLIEAVAHLRSATMMLIGQGPAEAGYRALADKLGVAKRVHFMGNIAHDDLPALLNGADVMALVSDSEGLANAWVEALACGTPIVASKVGGAPELVRSPDAGRLVERNAMEVVRAISELLAHPIPQDRVAAQVAHFSWDENARTLAEFFREVAKRA